MKRNIIDVNHKSRCGPRCTEAVAKTVWRAAHGKGLHYKVGFKTRLLFALFPFMPFGRRALVHSLTMEKGGK
ncbi:MAG: hypothetical protein JRH05_01610 [Deltaproteobacteria bacterium]|nr:hypothetical protein [Deltaproteobacteria bacterium]MBW2101368.1 hypothetical protein [Deltaproteobacteria bacterium]